MKNIKPIIGITAECFYEPNNSKTHGHIEIPWNYAETVHQAGGAPLIIPPTTDLHIVAKLIDGWLIPGGKDILPSEYGESKVHPKSDSQDAHRFQAESHLLSLIDPLMPVFGICYGCQFLNVVQGGTLIQHLPDIINSEEHELSNVQEFMLDGSSKLASILGTDAPHGRCYHHQAIKSLGNDLKITAHHTDGTVEAVEVTGDRWLLGVQWHPERSLEFEENQKLFKEFIKQATEFKLSKSDR